MDYSEAERHVEEFAAKLKSVFNLDQWSIDLVLDPEIEAHGLCNINGRYKMAEIRINFFRHSSREEILETLVHEFLHIVLWPICKFADTIHKMVAREYEDVFEEVYDTSMEETVTDLEKIFYHATLQAYFQKQEREAASAPADVVLWEHPSLRARIIYHGEDPMVRIHLDEEEAAFLDERWCFVGELSNAEDVRIISETITEYETNLISTLTTTEEVPQ